MQEPDQQSRVERAMVARRESPAKTNRRSKRVTQDSARSFTPPQSRPLECASRVRLDGSKRRGRNPVWWLVRPMWCKERSPSVRLAGAMVSRLIEVNTQTSTLRQAIATSLWAFACVKRNHQRRAQCAVRRSQFIETPCPSYAR
ncbi:hypothetical protein PMIN01_11499 [Paraphaeosphaeria minitans]|uniref:Uncharacterized protein n=1 Tax=Paraphaeosphaeria minitans TaxID=565426 RepID=A0A9P6KLA4_9PLEO|nr:hypothetical protein PMIN01_11499 [Paraphaeosphaeria minitans]